MTYRVLDLFSGIGGFSLGLERTGGFKTVAFCEIEPLCQRVLHKHWPDVPCYGDIRELTADRLRADGIAVDVLCGGFPCQDISSAGLGAGIDGAKSGLWREYARLISELRPNYIIVENVAMLRVRGLERVLGDLAACGYAAEWECIPASAVGAPHRRDRVWIVAHPESERSSEAGAHRQRAAERFSRSGAILADTESGQTRAAQSGNGSGEAETRRAQFLSSLGGRNGLLRGHDWDSEPAICRVVDGLSANVDRVAALGNSVVPQIPEIIGRAILEAEGRA